MGVSTRAGRPRFFAIGSPARCPLPALLAAILAVAAATAEDAVPQAGVSSDLDFDRLLVLKRRRGQLGLPENHKCNAGLKQTGYDNELCILSPVARGGTLRTLFRPPNDVYVGEMDLDFDARRLLFTMPDGRSWQIHEIAIDGTGLRQVSREEAEGDVDNFDACWLPDGRIVFASTASMTAVPCWHGQQRACNLFRMNADGSAVRQLTFDQDLDLHPAVLQSGQVVYSRWDYTGIMHIYLRPLAAMNPDGTGQRAVYGSNSYWPNALYFPRPIPGEPDKLAAIVSGYHGVNRMGELVILDLAKGWHGADGIVQRIPGRSKPVETPIRDKLVDGSWPKFLHPYPLDAERILVAAQLNAKASWGIYLVDVHDRIEPLLVDPRYDFFEPIPVRARARPPALPDRTDPARRDAAIYLHDIYAGPGLAGVPRGTIKRLRLVGYHFGYPGMAGPDVIGRGGPWEAMRILGTVPVYADGSAAFRVPANTPLAVQALDGENKAVQLMRSWYTAMPGETAGCVGCHETPASTPAVRGDIAAARGPVEIEPWFGPPRGFDFEREVQPVLDRYCVECHDGRTDAKDHALPDLRAKRLIAGYRGLPLSRLGAERLVPEVRAALGGTRMHYTPAYEALSPLIRRVNVEDAVGLPVPGEYHADTSELVQMLAKGHHGVALDKEAWERIVTWIDLNGPCHGTWNAVAPVPRGADRRRLALWAKHGGPPDDPEAVPDVRPFAAAGEKLPRAKQPAAAAGVREEIAGWPFDVAEAHRRQARLGETEKTLDLGGGVTMRLVRIPAGRFRMGDDGGPPDERPAHAVAIGRDFWIGECEVTNEQFARFDPAHRSGLFTKRFDDINGPGISLDGPRQPAVRVSWREAMAFCRWLSDRTGMKCTLPTEAEWEYACRAGVESPLWPADEGGDFSRRMNCADRALSLPGKETGGLALLLDIPADARFDDGAVVTAAVGRYRPNAWGLCDMHGNAAEWTRSAYRPYPYRDDDGRNGAEQNAPRVVRGGSFYDRPARCGAAFRLAYPPWQRVFNVGFRVVGEERNSPASSFWQSVPLFDRHSGGNRGSRRAP